MKDCIRIEIERGWTDNILVCFICLVVKIKNEYPTSTFSIVPSALTENEVPVSNNTSPISLLQDYDYEQKKLLASRGKCFSRRAHETLLTRNVSFRFILHSCVCP